MSEIYLIRHGMTEGNKSHRYIGRTDEPLCKSGIKQLMIYSYPDVEFLYTSPMKRCIQTAELIYPDKEYKVVENLRETDFGQFENKNAEELSTNPLYQEWIDSNAMLPFPDGESREDVHIRVIEAFEKIMEQLAENKVSRCAVIVHGGTIMEILSMYGTKERTYYDWHVDNGCGYCCRFMPKEWKKGRKILDAVEMRIK